MYGAGRSNKGYDVVVCTKIVAVFFCLTSTSINVLASLPDEDLE